MSTYTGTAASGRKRHDSHLSPDDKQGATTPGARTGLLTTPVLSRPPSPLDKSGDERPLGRARTMSVCSSEGGLAPLPRNFAGLNLHKLPQHDLHRASTMPAQHGGFDNKDCEQSGGQSTPPYFRNRGKKGHSSDPFAAAEADIQDPFAAQYMNNILARRRTEPVTRWPIRFQDSPDSDDSQSGMEMVRTDRKKEGRGRR